MALVNQTDQVPALTVHQERQSTGKQAKTRLVLDCGQSRVRKLRGLERGCANGGRVAGEAFI